MIYLDHSATSPLLPEAKQAIQEAMKLVGNASSLHTPGHLAHNLIEEARANIAKLINAAPEEIIFTSGGSESNNTVTNIFANCNIAVSAIEHPSLLESAKIRAKNCQILPVDEQGIIKDFELAPETKLVSIMLANNELGTIEPIQELAKKVHAHYTEPIKTPKPTQRFAKPTPAPSYTLFHCDATQALGKIPIDAKGLNVDYMTLSAHKIGGPVGIGALYVKKNMPFKPLIIGGHQEYGKRAGTYQVVNIAGFGTAAKIAQNTPKEYEKKVRPLRNYLAKRILEEIPHSSLNTPLEKSLPNILNVSFQAAEGESIQLYLDAHDIIVSTGSACASGDTEPSHVLMATKNDAEVAHSSIRFSLGLSTTKSELNQVMQILPEIIHRLQQISTVKIKGEKND